MAEAASDRAYTAALYRNGGTCNLFKGWRYNETAERATTLDAVPELGDNRSRPELLSMGDHTVARSLPSSGSAEYSVTHAPVAERTVRKSTLIGGPPCPEVSIKGSPCIVVAPRPWGTRRRIGRAC